jgi:hypothetical protein
MQDIATLKLGSVRLRQELRNSIECLLKGIPRKHLKTFASQLRKHIQGYGSSEKSDQFLRTTNDILLSQGKLFLLKIYLQRKILRKEDLSSGCPQFSSSPISI